MTTLTLETAASLPKSSALVVAIWCAVNEYARACGGDPDKGAYGATARQRAVSGVVQAIDAFASDAVRAYRERCAPPTAAQCNPLDTWALERWDRWAMGFLGLSGEVKDHGRVRMREMIARRCALGASEPTRSRLTALVSAVEDALAMDAHADARAILVGALETLRVASPPAEEPETSGAEDWCIDYKGPLPPEPKAVLHGHLRGGLILPPGVKLECAPGSTIEGLREPDGDGAPTGPGWWWLDEKPVEVTDEWGDLTYEREPGIHTTMDGVDIDRWGGPCLQGSAPAWPTADEVIAYDNERETPASDEARRVVRAIWDKPHLAPVTIQGCLQGSVDADLERPGPHSRWCDMDDLNVGRHVRALAVELGLDHAAYGFLFEAVARLRQMPSLKRDTVRLDALTRAVEIAMSDAALDRRPESAHAVKLAMMRQLRSALDAAKGGAPRVPTARDAIIELLRCDRDKASNRAWALVLCERLGLDRDELQRAAEGDA